MNIRKKIPQELKEQNNTIINMINIGLISLQNKGETEIFNNLSKNSLNNQLYIDTLKKVRLLSHKIQQRYKDGILTIKILDDIKKARNKSSMKIANIQTGIVQFGNYSEYIFNHKSLANKKINKLIIEIKNNNTYRKLDMPQNIKTKLIEYLQNGPSDNPFDCGSFAHFINGIEYHRNCVKIENRIIKNFKGNIKPGETITISDGYNQDTGYKNLTHFAIYIGEGFYISKFGNTGGIIIANSDEMKKLFGGSKIHKIYPNNLKKIHPNK